MKSTSKFFHPISIATFFVFSLISFWTLESHLIGNENVLLLLLLVIGISFVLRVTKIAASSEFKFTSYYWYNTYVLFLLTFVVIYGTSPQRLLNQRLFLLFVPFLIFVIVNLKNNADVQAALKMSREKVAEGKFDEAQIHIDHALELNPDDLEAIKVKGFNLMRLKEYMQALSAFETVFKKKPSARTTIKENPEIEKVALQCINLHIYLVLQKQIGTSKLTEPEFVVANTDDKSPVKFILEYQNVKFGFLTYSQDFMDYLEIQTQVNPDVGEKIKNKLDEQDDSFSFFVSEDKLSARIKLQNVPIRGSQIVGIEEDIPLQSCLDKMLNLIKN